MLKHASKLIKNSFKKNKASESIKFFFLGGQTACELEKRFEAIGKSSGKMIGFSYCNNKDELNLLRTNLEKTKADYLILDIGSYTPDIDLKNEEETKIHLKEFVKTIKSFFKKKDIILIHLYDSKYCRIGGNIRIFNDMMFSDGYLAKRKEMESFLLKRLKCNFIQVSKYYFYCKKNGYKASRDLYEPECYEDIQRKIIQYATYHHKIDERPDFELSLNRYIMYKPGLQQKALNIFLNTTRFVENMVLSSSVSFVEKYKDDLLKMNNNNWCIDSKNFAKIDESNTSDEFKQILLAYIEASNGKYNSKDVCYFQLFQNDVIPQRLMTDIQAFAEKNNYALPIQVNKKNAGYYFSKMTNIPPDQYYNEAYTVSPVVIDIFGSCFSRTAFNVVEFDFAVNHYWFHVPPIQSRNPLVEYNRRLFSEPLSWTDRLVQKQFDGIIEKEISSSKAEWLILDLYSLISPYIYQYEGCIYSDFKKDISRKLGAKKVDLNKLLTFKNKGTECWESFEDFLSLIKEKYGNKIILIDGNRKECWIGDDGTIYRSGVNYSQINKYLSQMFKFTQAKLGCYAITIADAFLPDEKGLIGRLPSHKQDLYYIELHRIIKGIVRNVPKKRIYHNIRGAVWIRNLLRLSKKNSMAAISAALQLTPLDECILSLGYKYIRRHQYDLAHIYDFERNDIERVINHFDFHENNSLKEKLHKVYNRSIKIPPVKLSPDYPVFSELIDRANN